MKPLIVERLQVVEDIGWGGNSREDSWWRKFRWKDGSPLPNPKTKVLYDEVVDGRRCLEKLEDKWHLELGYKGWQDICRKLWKSKLEIKIKIFFWKAIHGGLPIGDRVQCFGGEVQCRRCGHLEMVEHIFWIGCLTSRLWKSHMFGTIALQQFNELKGREIFPIMAWSFWK